MRAPNASSRSADPQREEAARFPCLATRAPAPATTNAAAVDTLNVSAPSPPVPHRSTTLPAAIGSAWRSITAQQAATTSGVSPY